MPAAPPSSWQRSATRSWSASCRPRASPTAHRRCSPTGTSTSNRPIRSSSGRATRSPSTVRDGYAYGRGIADDKGQLYVLLKAAALLFVDGSLPVNVRIVCDGEEEIGGSSISDFLEADERGADVCLIFDGLRADDGRFLFFVGTRGVLAYQLRVRTSERDLHSGLGNTALNATHALMESLQALLPRGGRLPDELRVGAAPIGDAERAAWAELRPGGAARTARGSALRRRGDRRFLRAHDRGAVDRRERPHRRQARTGQHDHSCGGERELHHPSGARSGPRDDRRSRRTPVATGRAAAGAELERDATAAPAIVPTGALPCGSRSTSSNALPTDARCRSASEARSR